ncbi:endonuclease/exonuclease/phosphatase family protein [Robiginitalea sp. IMCC43444]|uniref:endonuclease/exonuclease/phosphatase family protein n=1 Tax=Robiginitalea sp. IMCC43444 TaxID=3459121 RepID=UPI0040418196
MIIPILLFLLFHLVFGSSEVLFPSKSYTIRTVAFYNVENLFDLKNDSLIRDDDRTPEGKDRWTAERYRLKIEKITGVLKQIGLRTANRSPDLIGLCEIENRKVLEDLVNSPSLMPLDYGIVHYDSPDARGIDVALLYKKTSFIPVASQSFRLLLEDENQYRKYTRDQLVVSGYLGREPIHLLVNHWPSRSGGQLKTNPFRLRAAQLQRKLVDSLFSLDSRAKIISMGDYNDDPSDPSMQYALGSRYHKKEMPERMLFNAMSRLYTKGVGSLAYQDRWSLFDQILFSSEWKNTSNTGYRFWKAGIFSPAYLRTRSGRYRGYPYRTYAGGTYQGGFSDHFPVYAFLIKPLPPGDTAQD